jgi:NADH-quinone oxidoreductase subunit D
MELQRISSHLVAIATGGMEIGALTVMTFGFRDREMILDIFEKITGLRMNFGYVRPGGCAGPARTAPDMRTSRGRSAQDYAASATRTRSSRPARGRLLDLRLPALGSPARPARPPATLGPAQVTPYCGYENYDFECRTWDTCDPYGRFPSGSEMWSR